MRLCKSWIVAALFCVSSLVGVRPAAAQFPFEPGLEGELWQSLPPLRGSLHYPTDLVTLQVATVPDPITQQPIPVFRLYVVDQSSGRVLTFRSGPNGTWVVEPLPDADWNASSVLSYPETIALDAENNVLIADWGHSRIVAYTSEGEFKGEFPLPSEVVAAAPSPGAVFGVAGSGYIAALQADAPAYDPPFEQVHILDAGTGATLWTIGGTVYSHALGEFNSPTGVAFDAQGRLVVADYGNSRLQVFELNTQTNTWDLKAVIGDGFLQKPYAVAFDTSGRLLVSDTDNQRLIVYQPDFANGTAQFLFELNANGGLNGFPRGVIQDPYGRLMVADLTNHEIKIFQMPDLGVYNVKLVDDTGVAINTLRAGTHVHLQFSLTVPFDHNQVTDVTPTCAADNPEMNLVSGPTPVLGSPAAPVGVLLPGTAVRYSCEFEALAAGEVTFTVGGTGNGVDPVTGLPRTVAPPKTLTKVIACATCEMDAPTITAAVLDPVSGIELPRANWYNQDVVVRLTASDAGVGVAKIVYQIIGGVHSGPTVTTVAQPVSNQLVVDIHVTAEDRTALIFWAEDAGGTSSAMAEDCFPNKLMTCVPDLELVIDYLPPVASPFAGSTNEGVLVNGTLTATDVDGPSTFTYAIVTGPASGQLQLNADGTFTYTPVAEVRVDTPVTFTFRAIDSHGVSTAPATATITVLAVNDAPVANAESATATSGVAIDVAVSANDTDVDGDSLTVSAAGPASPAGAGVVAIAGPGTVTFTPSATFVGTATFPYTISDGKGGSSTATVTVTVTGNSSSNRPPVCSIGYASPAEIWPPNHRKVDITIRGVTDPDRNSFAIEVTKVQQDEPTNSDGDGNTWIDSGAVGTPAPWVRAERTGGGNGRVYEIFFTATDSNGASCSGTVKVGVPKSQGHGTAVDSGCRWDSTVANGRVLSCGPGSSPPGSGHGGDDDDDDGDHHSHHDGDKCDHERNRNGHRAGDRCDHERRLSH